MPRSARLNYPGGIFHAVSRFAGDQYILRGDAERSAYLRQLARALEKTDTQVLAYCLMSNHVHLVLLQGDEPLERLFKPLHTGFALWVHKRDAARRAKSGKAQGPVIAGRPRTVLVEEERYLQELVRYVHNNPVRAGLVRHAVASSWSSHQAFVGKVNVPEWLNVGYVLERFGSGARARRELEAFVRDGEAELQRAELSGAPNAAAIRRTRALLGDGFRLSDAVLGSEAFAAKVAKDARSALETLGRGRLQVARGAWERRRPQLRDVVTATLGALELDAVEFTERAQSRQSQLARQLIVWIWVRHLGGKQIDVARELSAPTYCASRWYGNAVKVAAELEELSEAILHTLEGKIAVDAQGRRAEGTRFRYQVELG